jgi:hypothetical protein
MNSGNLAQNAPIDLSQNAPLELLGQCSGYDNRVKRRYIRAQQIQNLAVDKYHRNGYGITYHDLISNGIASNKKQAQNTLKRCLQNNTIFTIEQHKPQHYYPACLRSEVISHKLSKNAQVEVTGLGYSESNHLEKGNADSYNNSYLESISVIQSLEGYVLPLLSSTPLNIHKIQLKLRIAPKYYHEIALPVNAWNRGKVHEEIIGSILVRYRLYANGTIMVFTESGNNPFKLEDEVDRSRLMAFFGQVRDRLLIFLSDTHERIVPDIMDGS